MWGFIVFCAEEILSFITGRQISLGEKAGQAEQASKDEAKTIAQLEAEQNAAVQHDSAVDELHDHHF